MEWMPFVDILERWHDLENEMAQFTVQKSTFNRDGTFYRPVGLNEEIALRTGRNFCEISPPPLYKYYTYITVSYPRYVRG